MSLNGINFNGKTPVECEELLAQNGVTLGEDFEYMPTSYQPWCFGIVLGIITSIAVAAIWGGSLGVSYGIDSQPFQIAMGVSGASLLSAAILGGCLLYKHDQYTNSVLSPEDLKEFLQAVQIHVREEQEIAQSKKIAEEKERAILLMQLDKHNKNISEHNQIINRCAPQVQELHSIINKINNPIITEI